MAVNQNLYNLTISRNRRAWRTLLRCFNLGLACSILLASFIIAQPLYRPNMVFLACPAVLFTGPPEAVKIANGRYIVVNLGSGSAYGYGEKKYKASGLYPLDSNIPTWTFKTFGNFRLEFTGVSGVNYHTYTSADGKYIVRVSDARYGPALAFWKEGVLLKTYSIEQMQPNKSASGGCRTDWRRGESVNEFTNELEIRHINGAKLKYNLLNGESVPLNFFDYFGDLPDSLKVGLVSFASLLIWEFILLPLLYRERWRYAAWQKL